MNKLVETRRRLLQGLVDKHGLSTAALMLGKPARQINDMLAGRKSFGDKVARQMEEEGELPRYYFDGIETNITVSDLYRTAEQPSKKNKVSITSNLNSFEEILLGCFRGMNLAHKEEMLFQANHFYRIDNPADKRANPFPPLSKEQREFLKAEYENPAERPRKTKSR